MYKKLIHVLFFLLVFNNMTLAKPKPHAKAQEIVNKIKIPSSFQANFIYTTQEKDAEEVQEIAGKLWIKANKYRLILDQQIIISNGTTIWSYFPEFNEVHINTCQAEEETDVFSPIQLLHSYQQGFVPTSFKETIINQVTYDLVELTPTDQKNSIAHLSLLIEKGNHQIKNIKALDKNSTIHSFMLVEMVPDMDIEDSYFEFDTANYEDLEIVDLR